MTETTEANATPSAFSDLEHELASTRRVLERVPDEHWGWKPHERSGSLGQLASHVAQLPFFASAMLDRDEFDVARRGDSTPPANREELLARFDSAVAALRGAISRVAPGAWAQPWTLRNGERVVLTVPRSSALRGMGISHVIHHRAQLTVYLRLLDIPIPGLYGPSADEPRGG